ncbi:hypothetical protein GKR70_03465 [Providencia alcalifaciens]|uniref:hypothetical protein n=1 Tax=Providencia alcalifaciens TaxID=126385 RepID=UPI0012B5EF22|nr:hypothetical protein [Providencia alcalifaciens]MTC37600.1 hypothetical protein [Providencia alcalifaciens]
MKKAIIGSLMALNLVPISVFSKDIGMVEELMIVSKYSGMCGVFYQLTRFQEATQMDKGDEFLERFMNTELARMNLKPEEFVKNCNDATKTYENYKKNLNEVKDEK